MAQVSLQERSICFLDAGLFRARVTKSGNVIQMDRQNMMALLQSDAEISDILMRAFILRRVELVAAGVGDVVLIGSSNSARTFQIKEFLMRNGHPYNYIDLESDSEVQQLLDNFHSWSTIYLFLYAKVSLCSEIPITNKSLIAWALMK